MKTNYILKWNHGTKKCIFQSIQQNILFSQISFTKHLRSRKYQKYTYFGEFEAVGSIYTFCYQNMHISENLNKILEKQETHTKTQKMQIFRRKHILSKKNKYALFPKNIHIREKFGDFTMKATFILKWNHETTKCIFWSIWQNISVSQIILTKHIGSQKYQKYTYFGEYSQVRSKYAHFGDLSKTPEK